MRKDMFMELEKIIKEGEYLVRGGQKKDSET